MHYRILAEAVMFVHFAFILFVVAGAVLTWRWPRVAWAHVPALGWAIGTVTIGFPCPLTSLEKALQRRGGGLPYQGGFVDRYLEDVVYPQEHTTSLRALAAVVILIGYLGRRRWGRDGTPRAPGAMRAAIARPVRQRAGRVPAG